MRKRVDVPPWFNEGHGSCAQAKEEGPTVSYQGLREEKMCTILLVIGELGGDSSPDEIACPHLPLFEWQGGLTPRQRRRARR